MPSYWTSFDFGSTLDASIQNSQADLLQRIGESNVKKRNSGATPLNDNYFDFQSIGLDGSRRPRLKWIWDYALISGKM